MSEKSLSYLKIVKKGVLEHKALNWVFLFFIFVSIFCKFHFKIKVKNIENGQKKNVQNRFPTKLLRLTNFATPCFFSKKVKTRPLS